MTICRDLSANFLVDLCLHVMFTEMAIG